MIKAKEKARELIEFYLYYVGKSLSDSNIGLDKAKLCAVKTCNEVIGYMGSDRGYAFWSEVKFQIEHWPKSKQITCKDSD